MSRLSTYKSIFKTALAKELERRVQSRWRRLVVSAFARTMSICAVAMVVVSAIGIVIGKSPFGNAVGAVIFSIAAVCVWKVADAVRPNEVH